MNRPELAVQIATPFSVSSENEEIEDRETGTETDEIIEEVALDDFGFEVDHFMVDEARVPRGRTFAELLTAAGVPYSQVVEIAEAVSSEFDVRRLRAGRSYRIYTDKWLDRPRYFVYQRDAVRYVKLDLDEATAVTEERPVTTVEREASGTISRSLYQSVRESGAHSSLVYALAEMFAWQIDFHRVQPGDDFNVIYEERMVGDQVIGTGDIVAARFGHYGQNNYGFYFDNEEQSGYFDEEGQSLRKQLLRAPLRYTRISSGYSRNRRHPVTGQNRPHLGTDYAAPHGTPIQSVGDGVVLDAHYTRGNGNFVRIRHNSTYTTQYLHMSRFADGIRPGVRVEQGETIGYVGSTGLATGPHVCFRFWMNGQQVNHRELEMPPSEPIDEAFADEFQQLADELIPRLMPDAPTIAGDDSQPSTPGPTAARSSMNP